MKNTWLRILALALLSLGSLAALTVGAQAPTAPAESAEPAKPTVVEPRADEPTEEEKKDPDGGFAAAQADQPVEELPPDMRGTADFDISFPIDI